MHLVRRRWGSNTLLKQSMGKGLFRRGYILDAPVNILPARTLNLWWDIHSEHTGFPLNLASLWRICYQITTKKATNIMSFLTFFNVYFCTSWSQMKIAPSAPTHNSILDNHQTVTARPLPALNFMPRTSFQTARFKESPFPCRRP